MRAPGGFRRLARALLRDEAGMGAVEFALIFPLLLVLFLGATELGVALTIDRKVKATAGYVADLTSQSMELDENEVKKLFEVASVTIAPYPTPPLRTRLVQVRIDDRGESTVDWWCQTAGFPDLRKDMSFPLPPQFASAKNTYVLVGQTTYDYTPITTQVFGSSVQFGGTAYVQPRYSSSVKAPGCRTFAPT